MTDRIFRKPTLIPKSREKAICPCRRMYVIEQDRQLKCRDCGRIVDPFDYLFRLAKQQSVIDMNIRIMRSEQDHLKKQIEELKKERRNLKTQISQAKKKLEGDDNT